MALAKGWSLFILWAQLLIFSFLPATNYLFQNAGTIHKLKPNRDSLYLMLCIKKSTWKTDFQTPLMSYKIHIKMWFSIILQKSKMIFQSNSSDKYVLHIIIICANLTIVWLWAHHIGLSPSICLGVISYCSVIDLIDFNIVMVVATQCTAHLTIIHRD